MNEKLKALIAPLLVVLAGAMLGLGLHQLEKSLSTPASKASSFVGYSQSCWQVGDTLTVVTAKGDTVRLDVSRLEGE